VKAYFHHLLKVTLEILRRLNLIIFQRLLKILCAEEFEGVFEILRRLNLIIFQRLLQILQHIVFLVIIKMKG